MEAAVVLKHGLYYGEGGGEVKECSNDETKLRCRPKVGYGTLKNALYFVVRAIIRPVGLDRTIAMHP